MLVSLLLQLQLDLCLHSFQKFVYLCLQGHLSTVKSHVDTELHEDGLNVLQHRVHDLPRRFFLCP